MKAINLLKPSDYFKQLNNKNRPWYECGNTSVANLISCICYRWRYTPPKKSLDDYIYEDVLRGEILQQYAKEKMLSNWASRVPEQVPELQACAATVLTNVYHESNQKLSVDDVYDLIKSDRPILIATAFYKKQKNGHFGVITGYHDKGFIFTDPLGNPLLSYKKGVTGYGIQITFDDLENNFDGIGVYKK